MKRETRFEIIYAKDGVEKHCYPRSIEKKEENLRVIHERVYKLLACKKLYPFSTMRNQHNFELIANITYNTMWDMRNGEAEWNAAEYDRLQEIHDKAVEFECMDLPVAWVPWETYCEMKEMAAGAICHRDAACALAREEADRRDSEWRPGDAPWKAPGMSARDFIR